MKALFDRRGFSKSAHLFKCVLYNFWAQVSSVPLGIYSQREKKERKQDTYCYQIHINLTILILNLGTYSFRISLLGAKNQLLMKSND